MPFLRINFMCLGLIGIGYFLVFQSEATLRDTIERRRQKSPTGNAAFEWLLLSPAYIWFVRLLELILFAFAGLMLWLMLTSPDPMHFGA